MSFYHIRSREQAKYEGGGGGLKWPQEKLKTMLRQNFGVTNKEHYGMLWYSAVVNYESEQLTLSEVDII